MQAKLDAAVAFAKRSQEVVEGARFDPHENPVLVKPREVVSTKRTHSQRRVNTGGGSAEMNDVLNQKETAIADDLAAEQAVTVRKEAAAGKKAEAQEAVQELQDAWLLCGVTCSC